ncbi:hypothetical protein [Sphingopyxis sp.]|uniref:hypothetical protein n=1 Tax=Sphingopyxis sp. TaxID=1908224 RepID=UPI003D6D5A0B
MVNWQSAQDECEGVLAEGVAMLNDAARQPQGSIGTFSGNYLYSLSDQPMYIGEAQNCRKRLTQQSDVRRSTFYGNYLKTAPTPLMPITAFSVRAIPVAIGRKEMEEFGIVNLPTSLNRFQLDKRERYAPTMVNALWSEVQDRALIIIDEGATLALESGFSSWLQAVPVSLPGLYLIRSDNGTIIYVGESSDMGSRFLTHGGRTYFSAVRRNLGTDLLSFALQTINGKKRYFSEAEDAHVTAFLHSCSIAFFPIRFGRYEVEEKLIMQLRPALNRKAKAQ